MSSSSAAAPASAGRAPCTPATLQPQHAVLGDRRYVDGDGVRVDHAGAGVEQHDLVVGGEPAGLDAADGPPSPSRRPPGRGTGPPAARRGARSASRSASSTATAVPPVSAIARRTRKSPSAFGTLIPNATVEEFSTFTDSVGPGLERRDDRRAPGRLDADEPRQVALDPAELARLGERLVDADQPDAAAGRVDDHVRHPPAELLGDLEAHRLLALDAVRLLERRHLEPVVVAGPHRRADRARRRRRSGRRPAAGRRRSRRSRRG